MKTALKPSTDPLNILLVEDNPGDAFLIRQMLEHCRRSVRIGLCQDGAEAISYLHRESFYENAPRPDLILLDLDLPRVDGWQVLNQVKENLQLQTIPVVLLSGSISDMDLHRSCFSLANDFIRKPEDWDHLDIFLKYLESKWIDPFPVGG
ncbi:MAG TPA: response regulator [bacterium]|nr:response regulator [bacterium]